jgi:hypothetical protein
MGTQSGWECRFCAHALGVKEVGLVRAGHVSDHKSSKRILCGEPDFNTLKTLDCKEAASVKPFVFRFES